MFTGTALRRATLRSTRRQIPAAVRAHGHGHSHGDGGHEHGQDYDDKDDVNIHSHTWPPKAGETWKNFKPVEKKEPGDRLAEVLDVIRNAKYESISRNQGRDDLAMRLAAAEQENEKLTEEVKKLEVVNEKAAQELLKDAEELAFMSVRLENLEKEAEALKDLNVKLVKAADQLAVAVGPLRLFGREGEPQEHLRAGATLARAAQPRCVLQRQQQRARPGRFLRRPRR